MITKQFLIYYHFLYDTFMLLDVNIHLSVGDLKITIFYAVNTREG